ncbi:unnamed protein product [Arabidopsis thaliana]|uniref:Uncharacterized protein n=1 Tax=Arabidopsis thaliana TaxID=3702 RepID=A0A5S9XI92_ARATH|nr:unnamed protein product [Arabidopsis thaliana]
MGKTNDAAGTFRARTSTSGALAKEDPNKHSVLGMYDDVVTVFQTLGMGLYWEMDEDVYPKLVKEFIATCRLTYANPENLKASQVKLTFFLNKQHYNKTLFEICDMY